MAEVTVARVAMEPSLLCVNCGAAPPPHRRKWDSCKLCAKRNLPATYYCGEACMEAHWPKHRQYHKETKETSWTRPTGPQGGGYLRHPQGSGAGYTWTGSGGYTGGGGGGGARGGGY